MVHILSKNEAKIIEYLSNNPSVKVNINQLSKILGISVGSTHLILKDFEKEGIVNSESIGNSMVYKINFNNMQAQKLIEEAKNNKKEEYLKKTKIVCTIGPASNEVATIRKMIENGMNIARINSSHGTEKSMTEMITTIRKADPTIPILIDIPGIKIRLNNIEKEVSFKKGDVLNFCSNSKEGCIPVDHKDLHAKISIGTKFSMDDGTMGFKVKSVDEDVISCVALNDGTIKSRKGMNIPGLNLGEEHLTESDKKLIRFAMKNGINFIGMSFIKSAKQVEEINKFIADKNTKLISKIETKEAIEDYHEIIEKSYGIMIDRGDLGAEVGLEKIPRLQKRVIEECNCQGKPIIIATQMLDSMTHNPYPTKSEITDVANAVLDGASAVMLSAETAVGKYPLEVVSTMSSIISDIENEVTHKTYEGRTSLDGFTNVTGAAISHITDKIKVDKIICITNGGFSARMLARHKLSTPIIATTNNPKIQSIMKLMWGVRPILVNTEIDNSASVEQKKNIVKECLEQGRIDKDDTILITGAVFPNNRKITNLIEIHKVHEFLGYFNEGGK